MSLCDRRLASAWRERSIFLFESRLGLADIAVGYVGIEIR